VKIGLFSDVHGNAVALDALLADLERHPVDRLVCLGDAIQGGPQPVECLERLRSLDCPVVMGNADWYVLTGDPGVEPETETQRPHEMDAVDEAQIPLAGFRAAARNGSGGIGLLGRLYGGIGHRKRSKV